MPTITEILGAIDAIKRGIAVRNPNSGNLEWTDPVGTLKDYAKGAVAGIGDMGDMVNMAFTGMPGQAGPTLRQMMGNTGGPVEATGGLLGIPGGGTLASMAKGLFAAKEAPVIGGLLGQLVFHGTPHKFDKFDLSKIGTGEGAQAYGHGMYFAENPAVAKEYQSQVFDMKKVDGINKEMSDLAKIMEGDSKYPGAYRQFKSDIGKQAAQRYDEIMAEKMKPGNLLKQDLPDEVLPKLLQWDRPLSEQPEAVKSAIADYIPTHNRTGQPWAAAQHMTGGDLVNSSPDIADVLRRRGIPGLSYLDQGSRAGGKGTMNHVIWDQDLLDRMTPTQVP